MTWTAATSNGNETRKVRDRIVPYLAGRILDIGCGGEKVCVDAIGVDWMSKAANIQMDITDPDNLGIFSDGSFDVVYSSHFLEDCYDYKGMLSQMWRIVKVDGVLILYLPHRNLYPNIGEVGANPNHKHDFVPADILSAMPSDCFVERNEIRSGGDEYSFELIMRKTHGVVPKERKIDKSKTVVIVRYGGFGDMAIVAPIYRLYKEMGYYVVANCSADSMFVLNGNPYIDEFLPQSRWSIPTTQLGEYFESLRDKYGKVVNLCETMECSLLVEKEKNPELWNMGKEERHAICDVNYSDYAVKCAGLNSTGNRPELYLTEYERALVNVFKSRHAMTFNLMFQLNGSSWHKMYPFSSDVIECLLSMYEDIKIFVTGGDNVSFIDFHHPRLMNRLKVWNPRQAMILTSVMDCVISPETGILNAAGAFSVPKIGLLTHSSKENLTKYFENDYSIQSSAMCSPCHKMIHDLSDCPVDKEFGLPICMSEGIDQQEIIGQVKTIYERWKMKSIEDGVINVMPINTSPDSLDTESDQKPKPQPCETVTRDGQSFEIC